MNLLDILKSQIILYLRGGITLAEFRRAIAPLSIDADIYGEPAALFIADELIGDLSDIDERYLTEDQLKEKFSSLLLTQSSSTARYFQIRTAETRTSALTMMGQEGSGIGFADKRYALEYA